MELLSKLFSYSVFVLIQTCESKLFLWQATDAEIYPGCIIAQIIVIIYSEARQLLCVDKTSAYHHACIISWHFTKEAELCRDSENPMGCPCIVKGCFLWLLSPTFVMKPLSWGLE